MNQQRKHDEQHGEAPFRRRLLRTPGAAQYLALAASTLEKARLSGTGPRFARLGRVVVYDLRDLDAWVEARKAESTSERPRGSPRGNPGRTIWPAVPEEGA